MARNKYRIPDQKSVTYGIPAEEIARICEISFRTACRWKSGSATMPATARMLLGGDLGCFDHDWSGWVVRGGLLVSPEGWEMTINMVMGLPLMRAQLAAYQTKIRKFDAMPEQPIAEELPQWINQALA